MRLTKRDVFSCDDLCSLRNLTIDQLLVVEDLSSHCLYHLAFHHIKLQNSAQITEYVHLMAPL